MSNGLTEGSRNCGTTIDGTFFFRSLDRIVVIISSLFLYEIIITVKKVLDYKINPRIQHIIISC
jgi:hypothetical protein